MAFRRMSSACGAPGGGCWWLLIQTFWENFSHKSTVDPTGLLGKMTLVMTLQKLSVSSRDIIVIYIYMLLL